MRQLKIALWVVWSVALLVLVGSYPAAWSVASGAETVQMIRPWDEALVEFNKWEFEEGDWEDDITAIYGSPEGEPLELVFVEREALFYPEEGGELALLVREEGEHFWQVKTVYYAAKWSSIGAGIVVLLLGGLLLWVGRKRSGEVVDQDDELEV